MLRGLRAGHTLQLTWLQVEIMEMKEQIKEMDQELERYHKNNSALELTISDLRLKLEGMQREILTQRTKLSEADAKVILRSCGAPLALPSPMDLTPTAIC